MASCIGAMARIAPPAHRLQYGEALVEAMGDFGRRRWHGPAPRPARWPAGSRRAAGRSRRPAGQSHRRGRTRDRRPWPGRRRGRRRGSRPGRPAPTSDPKRSFGSGRQRVHGPEPLTGHRQWLPAGGDDRDGGCLPQDPRHQLGDGLDQVLAVVEHQQAVTGAQQIDDGIVDRARPPQVHVDGRGQRGGRGILVDDPDELHDVHAVLELAAHRPGQLHGHRRLPDAAGSDQGHQPVVGDDLDELSQQWLPTDQRLHTDTDRRSRGHSETRRRPAWPSSTSTTVATNS